MRGVGSNSEELLSPAGCCLEEMRTRLPRPERRVLSSEGLRRLRCVMWRKVAVERLFYEEN